ncbi:unnamed protein product [Linum tenue]|uniref:CRC domain-containing protein n=1 Tax=Linum tenue TaxID=586396 RepID=A0AAV0P4T7_9ROSI|nr:unnamed protein product [Linum tenue]
MSPPTRNPGFLKGSFPDPSRLELSSGAVKKVDDGNEGIAVDVVHLYDDRSSQPQENYDSVVFISDASVDLPKSLEYDCGSPGVQQKPQQVGVFESGGQFTSEASQKSEPRGLEAYPTRQQSNDGAAECDWDSLIDAADLLIFNSPADTEAYKGLMQKQLGPNAVFSASLTDLHIPADDSVGQQEMEGPSTQPGETILVKEDNKNNGMSSNSEAAAAAAASNLYRGMRRRCLDFEMVGTRRKNPMATQEQIEEKIASEDNKQLVPFNPSSDSSKIIVPGIGLHLNSLAISSNNRRNSVNEALSSGPSLPSSDDSFHSPTTAQEFLESLTLASMERGLDPTENDVALAEDVSPASAYLVNEQFGPGSPKKKSYCECFAAGVYCIEPCSCQDCFNKPIHEDTVLSTRKQIESRNPLAFAPKVIRTSEPGHEIGDESTKTPASARHKRGCNCKKSSCLKKYCECYQGGVGCSINCRCEGCKNAFGRKDGSVLPETETEPEDDTEANEKNALEISAKQNDNQTIEEQNMNSGLPATPLQFSRTLVQIPYSSSAIIKPPRSLLGIGSSSSNGLYQTHNFGKPSIFKTQSKLENRPFQGICDDDIPEILRGSSFSPGMGIKVSSSPNSKRVSPPHHNNLGTSTSASSTSPGRRSGRKKLILQSIPSFPSLTPPQMK